MNLQCSSDQCADCQLNAYYGERYADALRGMMSVCNDIVETNDRQGFNYVAHVIGMLLATADMHISTSTGAIH
jgi:hypothetical protein